MKLNDRWALVKYTNAAGKDIYMFSFTNKQRNMELFADKTVAEAIIMPYIEGGYLLSLDVSYISGGRAAPYYFYEGDKKAASPIFIHQVIAEYKGLVNKAARNPTNKKIWFWDNIPNHLFIENIDLLERVSKGKIATRKADRRAAATAALIP